MLVRVGVETCQRPPRNQLGTIVSTRREPVIDLDLFMHAVHSVQAWARM